MQITQLVVLDIFAVFANFVVALQQIPKIMTLYKIILLYSFTFRRLDLSIVFPLRGEATPRAITQDAC